MYRHVFLSSQPKHLLCMWILKGIISLRLFFRAPKTHVYTDRKENVIIKVFMLNIFFQPGPMIHVINDKTTATLRRENLLLVQLTSVFLFNFTIKSFKPLGMKDEPPNTFVRDGVSTLRAPITEDNKCFALSLHVLDKELDICT